MPAFHKWKDEACNGFQIHVTKPDAVRSYALGLAVIRAAIEMCEGWFAWRQPPYEYEYEMPPALTLSGSLDFINKLESDKFSVDDSYWSDGIREFISRAGEILLYDREMTVG